MAFICIHTVGTRGDLNPFLLLGTELLKAGHQVRFATLSAYERDVTEVGFTFYRVGPDLDPHNQNLMRKVTDPKRGMKFLYETFFSQLRSTFDDLDQACEGADLLLTGSLSYVGLPVSKKKKIPWVSVALQPATFASDFQFPVLPQAPWLRILCDRSPSFVRLIKTLIKKAVSSKSGEWNSLLKDLGFSSIPNILFDGPNSPHLQIAAYSPLFSSVKPDWPKHRYHAGFIQPKRGSLSLSPSLKNFLDQGERPVVFTLGSGASLVGMKFFKTCLDVAQSLKLRAVFVCGSSSKKLQEQVNDHRQIYICEQEPYSELFDGAALIVHPGGIGTTGEALRAGVPMVIAPFGQDQYDNACHIEKLGSGLWIPMKTLSVSRFKKAISQVLSESSFKLKSERLAADLSQENSLDQILSQLGPVLKNN